MNLKTLKIITFIITGIILYSCASEPPPITPLTEERELNFDNLIWSDEFDGTELNEEFWNIQTGTGSSEGLIGWGNNELQYYSPENLKVTNGELIISAKNESYRGSAYTSARINTKNKVDLLYGRIEARIKLPEGQGLWPAFWMLPTDNEYGIWAASGEIDIVEMVGNEPHRVHGTIHFGGSWPENMRRGHPFQLDDKSKLSDDYHIYALEWTPEGLSWFVDEKKYSFVPSDEWITLSDEDDPDAPFDKRFHILLNLAVGGNWPGSPDEMTEFPAEMRVDYVRVYR